MARTRYSMSAAFPPVFRCPSSARQCPTYKEPFPVQGVEDSPRRKKVAEVRGRMGGLFPRHSPVRSWNSRVDCRGASRSAPYGAMAYEGGSRTAPTEHTGRARARRVKGDRRSQSTGPAGPVDARWDRRRIGFEALKGRNQSLGVGSFPRWPARQPGSPCARHGAPPTRPEVDHALTNLFPSYFQPTLNSSSPWSCA